MENTRIRFGSLTVHEDEEEIYSSSSSSSSWEYSSSSEEDDDDEVEVEDVRSPAHPYDLDALPKSVLLDVQAYFDDRTNATTAFAPLLMKHHIGVTLWIAHPPRVSCLTAHSTGVDAKEFANMPAVVAAQDDLLLLRVTVGPHDRFGLTRYATSYYVYKAGIINKSPSLILLPDASSVVFADCSAGILRLADADGGFIIAAIHWAGTHGQYHLHRFDSRTWSWSTTLMHADKPERFTRILTSKVLVIGGEHGLVAWVDLWNGILFCELLITDSTILRYCPLPPALDKRCEGPPEHVRDIAVVQQGRRIKFFEMRLKVKQRQVAYNTALITSKALVATTWIMTDPCSQEWHKDCPTLDIFKIIPVVDHKSYCSALMLPNNLLLAGDCFLERLQLGLPALSLHDDDVVYIMAKAKWVNRRASVLAVNLRNKVLEGVAKFDASRMSSFSYAYLASKCVAGSPTTCDRC